MGPNTSDRSNMRTKYSRFLTADSQGMYSVSFWRKRVEFRARVTSTSLALRTTKIGFNKFRHLKKKERKRMFITLWLQSCNIFNLQRIEVWIKLNPSHYLAKLNASSMSCPLFISGILYKTRGRRGTDVTDVSVYKDPKYKDTYSTLQQYRGAVHVYESKCEWLRNGRRSSYVKCNRSISKLKCG